jgi:hypothetical protein
MKVKYLLSICFINHNQEIFSEPFGVFLTYDDAQEFAENNIEAKKIEFKKEFDLDDDDIDELYEFSYTIYKETKF